jgi:hypothetical protein
VTSRRVGQGHEPRPVRPHLIPMSSVGWSFPYHPVTGDPLRADTDGSRLKTWWGTKHRGERAAYSFPWLNQWGRPVNSTRSALFIKHALEHGSNRGHRESSRQYKIRKFRTGCPRSSARSWRSGCAGPTTPAPRSGRGPADRVRRSGRCGRRRMDPCTASWPVIPNGRSGREQPQDCSFGMADRRQVAECVCFSQPA